MSPTEWGVHLARPVTVREVELLERSGIQVVTVSLPWAWMERREGNFDFTALHHLLRPLKDSSLRVQGLLGPAMWHALPEWLRGRGGADAPGFVDAYARYCGRLVAELDVLIAVRVEDDLNSAHPWETLRTRRRRGRRWRDRSFRAELLLAASEAVRAQRPELEQRVSLQAGALGWARELGSWLKQGLQVERIGLSFSPCSWFFDPQRGASLAGPLARLASLLAASAQAGGTPPEGARVSYPTHRVSWTPRRQRQFLACAARSAQKGGAVAVHWSTLRDQAYDDPSLGYWTPARERHQGLLYYDGSPKPAMDELRVLATGDRYGEGGSR